MRRLLLALVLAGTACKRHHVASTRAPLAVQTVSATKNRTCVIHHGHVQCVGQIGPRVSFSPVVVPGTEGALAIDDGGLGCAILADHTVTCFGAGAATRVPGIMDAVQIAAGRSHACARSSRGHLACWGKTQVKLDGVVDVAADTDTTCAVKRDGTVSCFGGMYGPAPKQIASDARKVAVHRDQVCVVHRDGTAGCLGEAPLPLTQARSVAIGERLRCVLDEARAVQCVAGGTTRKVLDDAVELVASTDHVCARDAHGAVSCFGDDTFGQLGDRATTEANPRKITDAKSFVLGGSIGCIVGERVACFSAVPPFAPPVDVPALAGTKVLARGRDHACAIDATGALRCFGLARFGQLGTLADTWSKPEPTLVADLPPMRDVAVGDMQTCATTRDGRVFCFGSNASGELALGTSSLVVTPTQIPALAGARAIALGMHHLCALQADGTVWCAGSNGSGELGHAGGSSPLLVKVAGLEHVVELGLRDRHSCARREDGTILCWGARFGDPDVATNGKDDTPRSIADKAISLGVGRGHACFVREGGDVLCWGDNRDGACGSPIGETLGEPRVVQGVRDAIEVRAGDRTSCARTAKDEIWCWGNDRVEGVPVTLTRSEPVAMRL